MPLTPAVAQAVARRLLTLDEALQTLVGDLRANEGDVTTAAETTIEDDLTAARTSLLTAARNLLLRSGAASGGRDAPTLQPP